MWLFEGSKINSKEMIWIQIIRKFISETYNHITTNLIWRISKDCVY